MKAFIIVTLSLGIISEMGTMSRGCSSDDIALLLGGLVRFVLDILAIIFVAVAM